MRRSVITLSAVTFAVLITAVIALGAAIAAKAQGNAPGAAEPKAEVKSGKPVLMKKEQLDVNDDGKLDTVGYFDSDNDGVCDAEAIDLGSTGHVTILAMRTDVQGDGKANDWLVVDANTEEVRAALLDTDHDGEVDTIAYADGKRVRLGDASASNNVLTAAFSY